MQGDETLAPKLILLAGVAWVGAAFLLGVRVAAARQSGGDRAQVAVWTARAAALLVAALAVESALALSGVIGDFRRMPPPFFAFMLGMFGLAGYVAFSRLGDLLVRQTSLAALAGFQAFRILAEWLLVAGHEAGLTPAQLTLHGYNFDIVTGVTAIPVALWLRRHPEGPGARALALAWNAMGTGFLAVIAFIAATSMPTPLRVFMNEPTNEWVLRFPFVFLPGVLVVAALAGHLLSFRKLLGRPR